MCVLSSHYLHQTDDCAVGACADAGFSLLPTIVRRVFGRGIWTAHIIVIRSSAKSTYLHTPDFTSVILGVRSRRGTRPPPSPPRPRPRTARIGARPPARRARPPDGWDEVDPNSGATVKNQVRDRIPTVVV